MVGDRMSKSNQILSSFEMKLNGKKEDEIQDEEIGEYLGKILATMDSSLDQPFKDWIATRNARLRDPTVKTSEEFELPEISRRQEGQEQVMSNTKVPTAGEKNEPDVAEGGETAPKDNPTEKSKPDRMAEKSQNERISNALKRYKQMKSGRDLKMRKKMKPEKDDTEEDGSSDSDIDNTRTSGAQRGDLRLQKEKIKETEMAVKKWRILKGQIKNKK